MVINCAKAYMNSISHLLKFAMMQLNVVRLLKISVGEIAGDVDGVGFILTAQRSYRQCLVECGSGIEHHPGKERALMKQLTDRCCNCGILLQFVIATLSFLGLILFVQFNQI